MRSSEPKAFSRAGWVLVAAAAASGVGELVRRRRSAKDPLPPPTAEPAPPPMTTQSSPGQIANLQEAYGAEMAPPDAPSADAMTSPHGSAARAR